MAVTSQLLTVPDITGDLPIDRSAAVRHLLKGDAMELAARAFELTDPSGAARCSHALAAVDALMTCGRLSEARDAAETVLGDQPWTAVDAAELRVRLSSILFIGGRCEAAVTQAEAVLAEPGLPDELYARAELARLVALSGRDDGRLARAPAEAILGGGHAAGSDAALAGALTAVGLIAWQEGHVADGLGFLRAAARRVASERPDTGPVIFPTLALATMLIAVGELGEASVVITDMEAVIHRNPGSIWTTAPMILRARLDLTAGRIDAAAGAAHQGLLAAEEHGARFLVPMARATLAKIAMLRGDLDEAARQVDQCRADRVPSWAGLSRGTFTWIEARLTDARSGPERAVQVLADVFDDLPMYRGLFIQEPAAAAWLTRIAVAVDDHRQAARVVAFAEQLANDNSGCPSVMAAAAHARALLDRTTSGLERAAADHRSSWARASALEDAGMLLIAADDGAAARPQLEHALAAYDQVGADRDAARVRARLRDLSARRRHRRCGDRPVSGWRSLTATEASVAELVAEGLTNRGTAERMFLSRHTVDFHLRQIFRKLSISSRVELARVTIEQRTPAGFS
jgi:ATP/maltotriose-dependent transcriptional regulator MalT